LVYNASSFNASTYYANITVSGSGLNSKVITVTLVVLKRPQPAINIDSLKPSCQQGFSPSYDSLYVWNSGGGTLNFTITDTVDWLQCIPDNGSSAGPNDKVKVKVIYSCDALYCGHYSGLIRISADNSNGGTPVTNRVELTVKQNWLQTTPAAPFSARSDHTTVVFDNKIWVIGGRDGGGVKNDVWYSDNR
jgi:hypothetical protein